MWWDERFLLRRVPFEQVGGEVVGVVSDELHLYDGHGRHVGVAVGLAGVTDGGLLGGEGVGEALIEAELDAVGFGGGIDAEECPALGLEVGGAGDERPELSSDGVGLLALGVTILDGVEDVV